MANVEQAQEVLQALGMRPAQCNRMSGLTLLALCALTPETSWTDSRRIGCTVTKGIMDYIKEHYGAEYAANTRETFRRHVLHQFIQGRIADQNPFNPGLPTNSPNTHYAISEAALEAVQKFGSEKWAETVATFISNRGILQETYETNRAFELVPVILPDDRQIKLSPGTHNELQKAIVENFAPRFAPGSALLYLGDTAQKDLILDNAGLVAIGIDITRHDKLPDVILYSEEMNWVFFIEAVTSHGPVSDKRKLELKEMLSNCSCEAIYVSAFPDTAEFRKHIDHIAWETEVWLSDAPNHLIHYDGEHFLGPAATRK